jgi:hypothetical protein
MVSGRVDAASRYEERFRNLCPNVNIIITQKGKLANKSLVLRLRMANHRSIMS